MGAWFEMYSSWETLAAQVLAALFVVGSYVAAERMKGRAVRAARAAAPASHRALM
jgi:high-affinity iron transporter